MLHLRGVATSRLQRTSDMVLAVFGTILCIYTTILTTRNWIYGGKEASSPVRCGPDWEEDLSTITYLDLHQLILAVPLTFWCIPWRLDWQGVFQLLLTSSKLFSYFFALYVALGYMNLLRSFNQPNVPFTRLKSYEGFPLFSAICGCLLVSRTMPFLFFWHGRSLE